MESISKRRRVDILEADLCVTFDGLPSKILKKILHYLTLKDVHSLSMVNVVLNLKIAELMRERTYLYVQKPSMGVLNEILGTKRKFSEIFFHGKQNKSTIEAILKQFKNKVKKLNFGKSDLSFMNTTYAEIINWINYAADSLEELKAGNIEIKELIVPNKITLNKLRKLKCSDVFLNVLHAPNVEEVKIFTIDSFNERNLNNINSFLQLHYSIKNLSFIIHCGNDVDVKNVDFKLDHLKLTHFKITSFRFNPQSLLKILENQKHLVKLHLEDGNIYREDYSWSDKLPLIFSEILNFKYLNKLIIELPTEDFLRKLANLPNLKRLSIRTITVDALAALIKIRNPNLTALAIEGIDFFERTLKKEDIAHISMNYSNLIAFKIDTAPFSVVDCILRKMEDLKQLKILHNHYIARKTKIVENNVQLPQTRLEKIVCDQDDFNLRILPIVKVSPELRHLKIYWKNKNTPIMSIIFEVLDKCPKTNLIEFKFDGGFTKYDTITKSNFNFSHVYSNYQVTFCRKNGKIKCCRF